MTSTVYDEVGEWLDERQGRFIAISDQIWQKPEVALEEYTACRLQADDLAADGFAITRNVGDLPTAFMAEWKQGEGGPVIGFLGEYDALPGLSQKNQDLQDPIVQDGPGHGCGHNLLGTASLAAASVLKAWLEHTGHAATVRYYGCPGEETGEGKEFMARAGAFDDLSMALTWHPGSKNTVWAGSSLAVDGVKFRFRGRTAHAAANPETGRSALDAVELMNVGVNFLREHMPEKARIHYVITNGGGAPNVVPDDAEVWYFIRSPERHQVDELTERVRKVAAGAALMTETTVEEIYISGSHNVLPNDVLADQLMKVMEAFGPIEFTPEEVAYAQSIADQFPRDLRESMLARGHLPLDLIDTGLSGEIWPIADRGQVMPGSTDVAEVSWIAPTSQITTATWALGIPGHSWAITATGAMSIGHKGMLHAARVMAATATDAILDPTIIERARAEFLHRTGGRPYQAPTPDHIMPRHVPPPD